MSDQPVEVRARSSHEARAATVLVLATERYAGEALLGEIRYQASGLRARVRVVAPALTGRLRYWASDEDRGYAAADAPTPLLAAWVLIMDLGVKLDLIGVASALFVRRPRADRLGF